MRIHNFAAGPAALPLPVLERAREELVDYRGTGMSVLEMSHRSPAYDEIHQGAMAAVRRLMGVPEGWSVLFLQGGASLQFSMVPMNLMHPRRRADYVLTGSWAKKAAAEARREGEVRIAASTESEGFRRVPRPGELDLAPEADYLHLTTNNTIFGTQMRELPEAGDVPLVLDMSSDVLSWPVPVERVGLLYAGAQKNLGPAGVTLVIVRDDLLERAPQSLATMLQYRTHAAADSLYNTPPTFAIYLLGLYLAWVEEQGGVAVMEAASRRKAEKLYAAIDAGGFYRGTAEPASRSRMNVTFRLADESLEKPFLAAAAEASPTPMTQLKGHRSVGGVRASLYNAVPERAVDDLVAFLAEFERRHG
jgi:phosphoserine aminotransferase